VNLWLIVKSPNAEFDTDMLKVIVFNNSMHGWHASLFSCFDIMSYEWWIDCLFHACWMSEFRSCNVACI